MGAIKVPTNFNIDLEFDVPEFYRRLLAWIIDFVILFIYFKIAFKILIAIARKSNLLDEDVWHDLTAVWMVLSLPILLYHLALEIGLNGQSVGKKIMKLKVMNEYGGKPSVSQFLIRWVLRDIWFLFLLIFGISSLADGQHAEGWFMLLLSIGYFITDLVLVVSSKKGQRIGDILAHTIIIRTNTRSDIEETVFQEVSDNYVPSFPQIMRLSDRDINAIKSILETAKRKADFHMASNAAEKIKGHLGIDSSLSPFDLLEVLLKDYNYLSVK
ncbi:MAG TPA: RDD family protein [Chitinophagaceae bacterium]